MRRKNEGAVAGEGWRRWGRGLGIPGFQEALQPILHPPPAGSQGEEVRVTSLR